LFLCYFPRVSTGSSFGYFIYEPSFLAEHQIIMFGMHLNTQFMDERCL